MTRVAALALVAAIVAGGCGAMRTRSTESSASRADDSIDLLRRDLASDDPLVVVRAASRVAEERRAELGEDVMRSALWWSDEARPRPPPSIRQFGHVSDRNRVVPYLLDALVRIGHVATPDELARLARGVNSFAPWLVLAARATEMPREPLWNVVDHAWSRLAGRGGVAACNLLANEGGRDVCDGLLARGAVRVDVALVDAGARADDARERGSLALSMWIVEPGDPPLPWYELVDAGAHGSTTFARGPLSIAWRRVLKERSGRTGGEEPLVREREAYVLDVLNATIHDAAPCPLTTDDARIELDWRDLDGWVADVVRIRGKVRDDRDRWLELLVEKGVVSRDVASVSLPISFRLRDLRSAREPILVAVPDPER